MQSKNVNTLSPVSYTHLDVYKRQFNVYEHIDVVYNVNLNTWHK